MEDSVDIPERLNRICAHFDITLNRLATKSGVHYNTLLNLRDGVSKTISGGTVAKICASYPIREEFMQYGRGEMLTTSSTHYENLIQQMAEKVAVLEEKVKMQEAQIKLYEKREEERRYLKELEEKIKNLEAEQGEKPRKTPDPNKRNHN